jgi:hypothetical protein
MYAIVLAGLTPNCRFRKEFGMCMMGMYGGPPYGIPIDKETHEMYSPELKAAWVLFDGWWQKAMEEADGNPVKLSEMPEDVRKAFDLIRITPIPEYEGTTGVDSCYMQAVDMHSEN